MVHVTDHREYRWCHVNTTRGLRYLPVHTPRRLCFRRHWIYRIKNTLKSEQSRRHCAKDTFQSILLYEICCICIQISLKIVPDGPIDNRSGLAQILTGHQTGNWGLSLLTHICDIRLQCLTDQQTQDMLRQGQLPNTYIDNWPWELYICISRFSILIDTVANKISTLYATPLWIQTVRARLVGYLTVNNGYVLQIKC